MDPTVETATYQGADGRFADYFGSIPHAELLKSVARRIVDRRVLFSAKQEPGIFNVRVVEMPGEETGRNAAVDECGEGGGRGRHNQNLISNIAFALSMARNWAS